MAKLWNLCNALKDDGVTYHQYVTELSYLLFLKMADELQVEHHIPDGCRWSALRLLGLGALLEGYSRILTTLGASKSRAVGTIFDDARTSIKNERTLLALIYGIERADWYAMTREGLGDLYEGLLERNANEKRSGAGQYFTPRVLVDSLVRVMQPSSRDVIQDPAVGTGGFLISAARYIRERQDAAKDRHNESRSKSEIFTGMEHVHDTFRLAAMNLVLHDMTSEDGELGIRYGDTLSWDSLDLPKATLILSNPPFGTKRGGGVPVRDDLPYPTSNKQLCFLQHIYQALTPGGRAAVVVPDNVLFEGGIGKLVRQDLMLKCSLHTVLRLPAGIFYAPTVKTNVLFFTKNNVPTEPGTTETWFYDLRGQVGTLTRQRHLYSHHFTEFEIFYGSDPAVGARALKARRQLESSIRYRRFDRQSLLRLDDNLDVRWSTAPVPLSDAEQSTPAQSISSLIEAMESSLSLLRELLAEVEQNGCK